MYARVNNVRLFYRRRGEGQADSLLLVHGFPLDHRLWSAQLAGLSSGIDVIAPDLPGCGRSEVPRGPYTMEQQADSLVALLDTLRLDRVIVGGLSMGGYIAFAFWRRHAQRVRALILADTRAEPDSPVAQTRRDEAVARIQEQGGEPYARSMLPNLLDSHNLETPVAARASAIMGSQPAQGMIGALQGMRDRADSRPTLATIDVPTLVLVGESDSITPSDTAREMTSAIPGASLAIVPRAGHLSPLENPRAFNAAVRSFLGRIGR